MAKGMGFKAFINEKPKTSNTNRLRKWKDDGEVVVWIHTNSKLYRRLVHVVTYTYTEKNEKTGKDVEDVGYYYFVCPEDPDEFMNRRRSNTYPSVCPLCRFINWVNNNDDIDPKTIVWETSIGDRKQDRICNKADITNNADEGGDWRLSMLPQSDYVMAVIDDDNVGDGILVAVEKYSLGEAIKKVVNDTIDSDGEELGDPELNPYAIKWVYNPKAKKATDYYRAYKYNQAALTPEIKALLELPAIDLSREIEMGDVAKLRQYMEAGIVLEDVPMDIFFDAVEGNTDFDTDKIEAEERKEKESKSRKRKQKEPEPEPESEEEAGQEVCPLCNGTGIRKGKACVACGGTGYLDEEELMQEPPPTKTPPASTKTRGKQRQVSKPKPAPKPVEEDPEVYQCGTCGKDVPADVDTCPHCGGTFE